MNNLAVSIRISQPDAAPVEITISALPTAQPIAIGPQQITPFRAGAGFVPLDNQFNPCTAGQHSYVHDSATGLVWTAANVSDERLDWEKADKACKALGDGWRLPTRAELLSLVDDTRHDPCIDTAMFPGTKPNRYWTSTPAAWSAECAWIVNFLSGSADNVHRYYDAFVRAVRVAAPAGQ